MGTILFYYFQVAFPLTLSKDNIAKKVWVTNEIRNYSVFVNDCYKYNRETGINMFILNIKKRSKEIIKQTQIKGTKWMY